MIDFSDESDFLIGDGGLKSSLPNHSQLLCSIEAVTTWEACQHQHLHYTRRNDKILPAWEASGNPKSLSTDFSKSELTRYVRLSREIPNLILRTHQKYPKTPPEKQLLGALQASYLIKSQWLEVFLLGNSALGKELKSTTKKHYKYDAERSAAMYELVKAVYQRETWAKAFDSSAQLWFHWLSEDCEFDLGQKGLLTVKGVARQSGKVEFTEENRQTLNSLKNPQNLRIRIEGNEPVVSITPGAAVLITLLSIVQHDNLFASKAKGPYQEYLSAETKSTNYLRNHGEIQIPYLDSGGAFHLTTRYKHTKTSK